MQQRMQEQTEAREIELMQQLETVKQSALERVDMASDAHEKCVLWAHKQVRHRKSGEGMIRLAGAAWNLNRTQAGKHLHAFFSRCFAV